MNTNVVYIFLQLEHANRQQVSWEQNLKIIIKKIKIIKNEKV